MLRLIVLHRIGDLAGDGGKEDEARVLHLADGERQRGEGREGGLVDSGREEDELDELRVHRRIAVEDDENCGRKPRFIPIRGLTGETVDPQRCACDLAVSYAKGASEKDGLGAPKH